MAGVNHDWLTAPDARRDPAVRAVFEQVVAQVNTGTAEIDHDDPRIFTLDGRKVLGRAVLEFALSVPAEFPRSYSIEFRGPSGVPKTWLPVRGLPQKAVHSLFATVASYPSLHPQIESYARAAMKEFEWYQNLDGEDCAMPGTFAVFALGLAGTAYAPLVEDYLRLVDDEHQSLQTKFVEAYIDAHGLTPEVGISTADR